ncbi:MAG TPA: hypothetical protein VG125_08350 [Pirellulales bacterium]|jgi:hypothetical protein|nr:hypothetical protein [Pirellulales bacterium]
MIWLVVGVVLVVVVVLMLAGLDSPSHAASDRASVNLHGIRKQQEVAQVKSEIRRDAAKMRRQLRGELSELDKRERGGP